MLSASFQRFFKFWFPVIGYSGIIFYVSGLPSLGMPLPIPFIDKLVHLVEYSILGFLFSRALKGTTLLTNKNILVSCTIFCILFGLSDELHQMFVPGRDATLGDALADSIGGLLGGIVLRK